MGLTLSASIEIDHVASQLTQSANPGNFLQTSRVDGRSEFSRPNRSGDSHLFVIDTKPSLNRGLPRFGMTTTITVWSKFSSETYKSDMEDVLSLIAWIISNYPSRGFATYIEPVLFYWDRNLVVVNEATSLSEKIESVFASSPLAVVTAPLDIDVGYGVIE